MRETPPPLTCYAGELLFPGDECTLRPADGRVYRRGNGEPRLGIAAEKFFAGEPVWFAGQEPPPGAVTAAYRRIAERWAAAAEEGAREAAAAATPPTPRDALVAGAARIARTLQAKGYLVIVTPVAELYPANGQGGEPAIELVLITPNGGERTPILLLAGTLAAIERGAAQHPPAGLRLAMAGGLAAH
jgi:hypothetical protein